MINQLKLKLFGNFYLHISLWIYEHMLLSSSTYYLYSTLAGIQVARFGTDRHTAALINSRTDRQTNKQSQIVLLLESSQWDESGNSATI